MDEPDAIRLIDERLHVLHAMQTAQRRPEALLQLVSGSTSEEALHRLVSDWGLDEGQAVAVLDLQVRRFSLEQADRLSGEIAFLEGERDRLLSGEGPAG